jgi:hypothetical protein
MKRINLKHWPQWLTWDRDLMTDGGDDDMMMMMMMTVRMMEKMQ